MWSFIGRSITMRCLTLPQSLPVSLLSINKTHVFRSVSLYFSFFLTNSSAPAYHLHPPDSCFGFRASPIHFGGPQLVPFVRRLVCSREWGIEVFQRYRASTIKILYRISCSGKPPRLMRPSWVLLVSVSIS